MKKLITLVFALLMVAAMTFGSFAASGSFVESPSKMLAPELISAENASDGCTAVVVVTAYADRAKLGEQASASLEAAYAAIAGAQDMGTMSPDIAALADELGIASTDFAVSELFDISYTDCDGHEVHGTFTVVLKSTTENVASMLHYVDGEWKVIPVEVKDGKLTFEVESFSPFAIMTHAGLPAEDGCCWICWLIVLLILILLIIVIVVIVKKKKEKKSEDTQA